jgi:dynein heavy chain
LKKEVESAFGFVEAYAAFLLPYIKWYFENINMDVVTHFRNKEVDEFRGAVVSYKS